MELKARGWVRNSVCVRRPLGNPLRTQGEKNTGRYAHDYIFVSAFTQIQGTNTISYIFDEVC
jgi:hypothetical protein